MTYLEDAEQSRQDVDLDGLLARRLGLPDTLGEVLEHLQPMLVRYVREYAAEQQHGRVDDGNAQRQRTGHELILGIDDNECWADERQKKKRRWQRER